MAHRAGPVQAAAARARRPPRRPSRPWLAPPRRGPSDGGGASQVCAAAAAVLCSCVPGGVLEGGTAAGVSASAWLLMGASGGTKQSGGGKSVKQSLDAVLPGGPGSEAESHSRSGSACIWPCIGHGSAPSACTPALVAAGTCRQPSTLDVDHCDAWPGIDRARGRPACA